MFLLPSGFLSCFGLIKLSCVSETAPDSFLFYAGNLDKNSLVVTSSLCSKAKESVRSPTTEAGEFVKQKNKSRVLGMETCAETTNETVSRLLAETSGSGGTDSANFSACENKPCFSCSLCEFSTPHEGHFRRHSFRRHHVNIAIPEACRVHFQARNEVKRHMKKRDSDVIFDCPLCEDTFQAAVRLKKHMHDAHGLEQNACNFCSSRY